MELIEERLTINFTTLMENPWKDDLTKTGMG
jgi:hypothetical protein